MNRFFHLGFRIISRRHRRLLERELMVGGNPWKRFSRLIVSMDYVKQSAILMEATGAGWDVVVIDEAHKVAKPHRSASGADPAMKRYQLGKKLAEVADHLLLLSATPHNGYRDTFASLLNMVNTEIVSGDWPQVRINKELATNHVCQRRRKDVEEWFRASGEESPFPSRDSQEISIPPSSEFEQVMRKLEELGNHIISASGVEERKQRIARWTVIHFYKRALSSPYALERSLLNRMAKARARISGKISEDDTFGLLESELRTYVLDDDLGERLSEEEVDQRASALIIGSSKEVTDEQHILEDTLRVVRKLTPRKDLKIQALLTNVLPRRLKESYRVIIFTRFKDTQEYIVKEILKKTGTSRRLKEVEVFQIHGELNLPMRKEVFKKFRSAKRAVLVTTDCMSEGIDLQYASDTVIHYELPWNPNRLEQRSGRVDRFGQPHKKVFIRTFVMQNSIEARILDVIVRKAEQIREDFGFAPPFFGDDLMIIDTMIQYGIYDPQTTLADFDEGDREEHTDIVSPYTDDRLREITEDSFYGQTKVDLAEVTERMEESMRVLGSPEGIRSFVTSALNRLHGSLESGDEDEVFVAHLPKELADEIQVNSDQPLLVTFDRRKSARNPGLHVLDLQSPIVSKLVSKIAEKVFILDSGLYGRTSAVSSSEVRSPTAVYHVRLRFVAKTNPITMIEELVRVGLEIWGDEKMGMKAALKLWKSTVRQHGRTSEELVEALDDALHHVSLFPAMLDVGEAKKQELQSERKRLMDRLRKDGLSMGLSGMDEIEFSSMDLVGVTLFFPYPAGGN